MDDRLLVFDLLPFERLLRPQDIEALAVLPGRIEETPSHLGADVRVAHLERSRLDRERATVLRDQLLADAAGAVAHDALGLSRLAGLRQDRQARADAVCGIVHRRKALPVPRPA